MHSSNLPLSSADLADPSQLRVNVIIARSVDYDGIPTGSIEVFIRDEADEPVANESIQVQVNGRPLILNNDSSIYFGAYPHYRLTDSTFIVGAGVSYMVIVVLTDGQAYTLGTIQTLPAITPAQFLPPDRHSRQQALTLTWRQLEPHNWFVNQWKRWQGETSATTLRIAKSKWVNDLWNDLSPEQGSADKADYLAIPIGAGDENYTIPLSYFEGPLAQFNCLDLQIDSEKNLLVTKPFREGSVISSVNTTLYRIEATTD